MVAVGRDSVVRVTGVMVRGPRIAGATATAFLGSSEVTDANTASPGALAGTRYYAFGGTTVALRDGTGVSYLIGDVQGSATVLIPAGDGTGDPDAVDASRNAYTPYGVTRGDDNLTTDRGWLGQVEDASSGLTYLNARYYDPAIARFISPDPLMDPSDPRTLDPYRYADNNPVLFTDASGLAPSCPGLTGQAYKNCSGYATSTYNYMTGKTTAKKNEELAKSGKAGVNKTSPKKSGGSAKKVPVGAAKGVSSIPKATRTGGGSPQGLSFGQAFANGSCGSTVTISCAGFMAATAYGALELPKQTASQAGVNLAMHRHHPGALAPGAASSSARILSAAGKASPFGTLNSLAKSPWFKGGSVAVGGASAVWGTYSATQGALDRGEEPAIAAARGGAEVAATGSGLLASVLTASAVGAAVGTVVPGLGNVAGFVAGAIVGVITYAVVSHTLNKSIDEITY